MDSSTFNAALAGLLHNLDSFAARAGVEAPAQAVAQWLPKPWRAEAQDERAGLAARLAARLAAGGAAPAPEQDVQLLSIFCRVKTDGKVSAPHRRYWPLSELRLDEKVLFPQPALNDGRHALRSLWDTAAAQAARLAEAFAPPDTDRALYLEGLLLLLQRFAWCVPSPVEAASLYDYARVTAALACILMEGEISNQDLKSLASDPDSLTRKGRPGALLVGGDISGVQEFLYTITARGASGALRGRSFYLQLLTEAAARFILRRLELPATNLLYQGGGHFYLLARPSDGPRLKDIGAELGRVLYAAHRGDLYMALAAVELDMSDFSGDALSQRWKALTEELGREKLRRFADQGADLARAFEPQGHGGNEEQACAVCGSEDPHPEVEERAPGEPVRKCQACSSYEELGEKLRSAGVLALLPIRPDIPAQLAGGQPLPYAEVLGMLGLRVELGQHERPPALPEGHPAVLLALTDAAMPGLAPAPNRPVGRRMLANVMPLVTESDLKDTDALEERPKVGNIKPFELLAQQAEGVKRLGALRMDVDNLGTLFSKGLESGASLARVAALSLAVSLYFEGWVGALAEQINRKPSTTKGYHSRLYSIYAGGDDLFFTGAWDAVVELARRIRADLTRYACEHPGITTSAGLVLVSEKFPLAQAARLAGEAEDKAKQMRWQDGDQERRKDAVCFLGQSIPWKRFGLPVNGAGREGSNAGRFDTVSDLAGYLEDKELHPLLRRLIRFQEMYQAEIKRRREAGLDVTRSGQPQSLFGRWNWLAAYTLRRAIRRTSSEAVKELDKALLSKEQGFASIEWIGLAARWAELKTR